MSAAQCMGDAASECRHIAISPAIVDAERPTLWGGTPTQRGSDAAGPGTLWPGIAGTVHTSRWQGGCNPRPV
jgi:hypothetical protein